MFCIQTYQSAHLKGNFYPIRLTESMAGNINESDNVYNECERYNSGSKKSPLSVANNIH